MSSWIVFGGEDQKTFLMASRRQQRATPRSTTNIVVRNGPAAPAGGATQQQQQQRRKRRNRRRRGQAPARMPSVPVASANPRRRQRPNSRIVYQRIVTTLGTVGSNNSDQIETELAVLLNPSTMKEATGSNSYGPLQIYASTYSLFQMRSLNLHLKPLVGASAVSGTIVRMSWNPTNNPTQVSWSALGARKHSDTTPGRPGRFRLTFNDLKGPKDGWFKTNTKGDPMLSFAGSVEIHSLGKTMSTYQSKDFTGGLFLAELETIWAFKDYAQQPGFMNLLKGDSTGDAKLSVASDGTIQLTTGPQTRLARAARIDNPTVSDIIWMVTDTIIDAGAGAFPPPFNWLFRGGWWFLKRIANAPVRAEGVVFNVYASINDARSGSPCIATSSVPEVNLDSLHFQQLTPGNVGIADDIPRAEQRAIGVRVCNITSAHRHPFNKQDTVVAYPVYYMTDNLDMGVGFRNGSGGAFTMNVIQVEFEGDIPVSSDPPAIYIKADNGGQPQQIGFAHAHSFAHFEDEATSLEVHTILMQSFTTDAFNVTKLWRGAYLQYPSDGTYKLRVHVPEPSSGFVRASFNSGGYYLLQFFCYRSVVQGYTKVYAGSQHIASIPTQVATTQHDFTPGPMHGLMPYTSFDFNVIEGSLHFETVPSTGGARIQPEAAEDDLSDVDSDLEMADDDHYSDPPLSALGVEPQAQSLYDILRHDGHSERDARMAVNQLFPSESFIRFNEIYHDRIVDGFSPAAARRYAMGL
nr:MAG: capsid protein [Canine astrovirus]